MRIDIVTIFPEAIKPYLSASIIKRAQQNKRVMFHVYNLRDWATGRHRQVDDKPYGGGAGMVMMVEPFYHVLRTLRVISHKPQAASKRSRTRVILTSAKGRMFTQRDAERCAKRYDRLIILSGHYEGVDERVAKYLADEELSIGPYVITGGELPALVIADAVTRLIPGVLGNAESLHEESHASQCRGGLRIRPRAGVKPAPTLEYPHYTRPADFSPRRGIHWKVPVVLLGGNHAAIAIWRKEHRSE